MSSRKKIVAIVITTAALSVGTVGVASASQTKSNTKVVAVRQTTTRTTVNAVGNPMAGAGMGQMGGQASDVTTVLAALVKAGTITQVQADAITAALTAARTAHEANEPANPGPMGSNRAAEDALIAATIGKTTAEIQTARAAGSSLATIAGDKTAALIAALVADETKQIDAAVAAGKMTAAQATTLKAGLTAHVTAEVNAVRPAMGSSAGMPGGMGWHGHNH